MKLKTSFFNLTVLRKNLIRFAPLWVLYAVGEVLGLLTMNLSQPGNAADSLVHIMGPIAVFHAAYALVAAACLFGDLFDSRLCNGLHAMPMRRDGWLLTNLVSGLLFALIPAVVSGTVAAIALREFYWIALLWQATGLLQFVFFFGLAVFCAMCAGKRLSMIAIYVILNYLSWLIFWVANVVYQPLLPGVVLSDENFYLFSPVISMMSHECYVNFYYDGILGGFFRGFEAQNWSYLYICAALGVLFMVLAWLVYRKRHLESAGDFVSFRPMRMFFLLTYTLAMGVAIFSFSGAFFGTEGNAAFLVVGLLIGWFTGWMLLERTVKVFTKKVMLGCLAFAVVFAGTIGVTVWDPAGITRYVPQTQDVEFACVYPFSYSYYYAGNFAYGGRYDTEPDEIAQVQELHKQMIDVTDKSNREAVSVGIKYRLKNGKIISRSYEVPAESTAAENLRPYFSDLRSVFGVNDWSQVRDHMTYGRIYWQEERLDTELFWPDEQERLLEALEADAQAGLLAQNDWYHGINSFVANLSMEWTELDEEGFPRTRNEIITIYDDCVHTCAFLETLKTD